MNNEVRIEMRGDDAVVTWGDDDRFGCYIANMAEKEFWKIIQQLRKEVAAAKEASDE